MQVSTKALPAKPVISASIPLNISAEDKKKLIADMERKAAEREAAIARQHKIPSEASKVLKFELKKFGHYWQGYVLVGKKYEAVLPSPSNLPCVLGALDKAVSDAALKC